MARLHRNNAAEWVMTVVLWPFAWIGQLLRGSRQIESTPPKKSRPAMIEGLPPRTMN
jgi:hypothetical protein